MIAAAEKLPPMQGRDLEFTPVMLSRELGHYFMLEDGILWRVPVSRPDLLPHGGTGGMKSIDGVPCWESVKEWPATTEYDLTVLLCKLTRDYDEVSRIRKRIAIVAA